MRAGQDAQKKLSSTSDPASAAGSASSTRGQSTSAGNGAWLRGGAISPKGALSPAMRERFADLVGRIAASKDREAFSEIFDFYAPRVKSYILRLGADDGLAEELAQEVMISVWRKAHLFDREQASVSTWIFRIARNRRIDALRRRRKPELDPQEPLLQPADVTPPEKAISARQTEDQVRAALAELPQEQVALLQAAFYEGLSHRDIAERSGLPLGTVKSRIRLAFQKLKTKLEDE
ncbi:MAG: sigma-70 family RNA polymerase sigma factor [Pseudomonadota bacterium]